MTRSLVFVLIFFLMVGTVYSKGYELKKKTGEYETEVKMHRYPPVLGDNRIEIEIKDAGGNRVTDAKVLVNYYMPPMPRMVPMNYRTYATFRGGRYRTSMNLIMEGPWYIAVKVNLAGKTSTAKFHIDVR